MQDPEQIQARAYARSVSAAPARGVDYTRISQFKHLVEIYAGSISTVYKGVCVATGLRMVVKVYHKAKMTAKQVHKLAREIDIQQRVQGCPFVCQLLATFEDAAEVRVTFQFCAERCVSPALHDDTQE